MSSPVPKMEDTAPSEHLVDTTPKPDAGVQSLLSRIGGLATEDKDNASEVSSMDIKGSSAAAEEAPDAAKAGDEEEKQKEASAPGPASKLLQSSYDVKVTLRDQQADPNSPLFSIKSFEDLGLHPQLLKGLYAMKFQKPSKIQEKALPLLLANPPSNMIAQSQSGTGKTAAFSLTMLSRIAYGQELPQAICLAPSRELARQIEIVIQSMGKFLPLQTFLAVKDGWDRNTKVTAQVIVGTPGTVMDMIGKRVLDVKGIKVLVLDEADDMLDIQGLGDHTLRIKKMIPPAAQTLLFSATFPDRVDAFAKRFAPDANEIRLKPEELSVEGIKQFYMDCESEEVKYDVLLELYNLLTIGQSIIFCARRDSADVIANRMIAEGHSVAALHGAKDANERDLVIDGFRDGNTKVLITTNVIARGIDISQVTMVVNYDLPTLRQGGMGRDRVDTETYLHRVGRTGRFGRQGIAVNFVSDENSWQAIQDLKTDLGRDIVKVATGDFDEMEKTLKFHMKK
ncbi:hypothetical protein FFLO_03000 [Filobasidium floriforme]|uniref:RNA helicase n=1 Tax=Filobasidium floriforme TaxID=5210 RepID=A0A8K0JRV6_9TREE|nr:putative DBP5-RNA helicase [Filobasidium floriforme]KAG7553568.1 hypothetical protein FFLO_03000 [Filobasidium floriforme]KAH8082744.1 putative DBP5-RNA helicase [Filobasidium floriforme]